jgi:hypothetical protein
MKIIFDVITRTLVYVEFKHISKNIRKSNLIGNNSDLNMVQDSMS